MIFLFMLAPEYVDRNGVAAHCLGHQNAMFPILVWNARQMYFSRTHLKHLSVEEELLTSEFEGSGK